MAVAAPSTLRRIRARLAQWLEPQSRALVPPQYRFGTFRQGITQTENQPTPDQLLVEAFRGTQATASRAIARRVGDLEPIVARRTRNERGRADFIEDPTHPLLPVLERPSPLMTRRQLLRLLAYWLNQEGNAYLLKVTNGGGRVVELWPLSPRNVERVAGEFQPVSRFVFHGERGETSYRLEEIVWIFDPDPAYPFQGIGVVGPQASTIDSATFASATLREHYQNDATPKTVLLAKDEASMPNQAQRAEFAADWVNRYGRRTGTDRNTPAFLPSGFDLRELLGAFDVGSTREAMEHLRDEILMANGVPRSILGDVVDANRAAAETNQFVFDLHTITPWANLISDALTYQLAQPDYGPETFVRFREFVSGNADLRLREEDQDLRLKVRSPNEIREARGLEAVEWGDFPVGSIADVPYTGDEPEVIDPLPPQPGEPAPDDEDDPDQGGDEDDDGDQVGPPSRSGSARAQSGNPVAALFAPRAEWSRVVQRDREWVPLAVNRLRRVFAAQRAAVLEALAEGGIPTARAWSRADDLDALFDGEDFRRLFDVLVTPVTIDSAQASRQNVLELLKARPSLSFTDAAVRLLEQRGAELVTSVNRTTKERIRRTLARGTAEGDSLQQLTARVRKVFTDASSLRARTIARTEILQAVQFGQLEGYRDSGVVVGKRWNTAQDERVRDSHEIDGQTVEMGETFTLGDGEQADAPGLGANGTRLSPQNAINCRCFTTPVLEGDL